MCNYRTNSDELNDQEAKTPTNWIQAVDNTLTEDDRNDFTQSFKLLFLVEILKQCESIGDKVLFLINFKLIFLRFLFFPRA